jgi:hypothetical protein
MMKGQNGYNLGNLPMPEKMHDDRRHASDENL